MHFIFPAGVAEEKGKEKDTKTIKFMYFNLKTTI